MTTESLWKLEIKHDSKGRIETIRRPDGRSVNCEYDSQGLLVRFKFPVDGDWSRNADAWLRHDKNGNVIDQLRGEITVSSNGDLSIVDVEAGETEVCHADGSLTTRYSNGSSLTRSRDGLVLGITHPNGRSDTMEYDEHRNLRRVILPDRGEWLKTDKGWLRRDANGLPVEVVDGEISVRDNGDIVLYDFKTGETDTTHLNGSISIGNADGSQMTVDFKGRVLAVTRPDGKWAVCEYDDTGRLMKVRLDIGDWHRVDLAWERLDEQGNVVDRLDGDMTVTADGDVVLRDRAGFAEISHLDGSLTLANPDGSRLTKSADGKVIAITHPNGGCDSIEYDSAGQVQRIVLPDDGAWIRSSEGWQRVDDEGNLIEEIRGEILVSDEGDLVLVDHASGETDITHLDGTVTVINSDNSQITINARGQVIALTQVDGNSIRVEYASDHSACKIIFPGGDSWSRVAEGWARLDEEGHTIDMLYGKIIVDENASIILVDEQAQEMEISYLDGSHEVKPLA